MRSIFYLLTFFVLTPITLVASLVALSTLSNTSFINQEMRAQPIRGQFYGSLVYAAIPSDPVGTVLGAATQADARVEIIRQYLEKYNSPLEPYAQQLIDTAEKYNLDFRLLVAIAQQESNLCKKIPANSYNCWGWGIHSKGTLRFDNYEEAMDTVAFGLRTEYLDKGYTTPEEIMSKYTPLSPGTWAYGVNKFMKQME